MVPNRFLIAMAVVHCVPRYNIQLRSVYGYLSGWSCGSASLSATLFVSSAASGVSYFNATLTASAIVL